MSLLLSRIAGWLAGTLWWLHRIRWRRGTFRSMICDHDKVIEEEVSIDSGR